MVRLLRPNITWPTACRCWLANAGPRGSIPRRTHWGNLPCSSFANSPVVGNKRWHRLARFRLLDADLEEVDAGERARLLEERLVSFRLTEDLGRELRAAAELKLADALRDAATDSGHWEAALAAYRRALGESPGGEHAPRARFGAAASRVRLGETAAAVDSLKALLGDLSGSSLIPEVLFELGPGIDGGIENR